ncbi:MAG: hypothetical protein ACT443_03365 [Gemmatimonadota bacterium]
MRGSYVVRRFGLRPTRGWVSLFIIVAALAAGAFWIGPFRPRPPQLKLLALSGDGRFREFAGIPSAWADTLSPANEATARFPLILAIHNAGARSAQPTELALSVPSRFRVTDSNGIPLPASTVIGNPLVRYQLPLRTNPITPGRVPTVILSGDTLWLEAVVPAIYCTTLADSVPEFVSAPPQDAELLSRVRIFYSFSGNTRLRQTGLLTIQVDPDLIEREPAPQPPVFRTEVFKPAAPRPPLDALIPVGDRITWCGDPGQPVELHSSLWETPAGGRFFVLYHGGVPRKYLFDLNRDSIIELEMWDKDADGRFESRRVARMAIPAFLIPYPKTDSAVVDSMELLLDSAANTPEWLGMFYDTLTGPLRFSGRPRAQPAPAEATAPALPAPATAPATAEWLRLFNNSAAGPLRFYRAQRADTTIAPARPQPPQPPQARPRSQERPKLLGVPVDSIQR